MGVPLVLNARTDVYLLQAGKPESRFATPQASFCFQGCGRRLPVRSWSSRSGSYFEARPRVAASAQHFGGSRIASDTGVTEDRRRSREFGIVAYEGHSPPGPADSAGTANHGHLPCARRRAIPRRSKQAFKLIPCNTTRCSKAVVPLSCAQVGAVRGSLTSSSMTCCGPEIALALRSRAARIRLRSCA